MSTKLIPIVLILLSACTSTDTTFINNCTIEEKQTIDTYHRFSESEVWVNNRDVYFTFMDSMYANAPLNLWHTREIGAVSYLSKQSVLNKTKLYIPNLDSKLFTYLKSSENALLRKVYYSYDLKDGLSLQLTEEIKNSSIDKTLVKTILSINKLLITQSIWLYSEE